MGTRGEGVKPSVVEDQGDRHAPSAERLGSDDHVGHDAMLLEGKPTPGSAAAALDLVDDQRNVELAGQPAKPPDELGRRWNDPALALDHLDDHGGGERDAAQWIT